MAGAAVAELNHADTLRLLDRQTAVLELLAAGAPLPIVLTRVVTALEELIGGARCSILLLDPVTATLHHGAAPTLPASYAAEIDGMSIGPDAGSCGTCAYLGYPVVAEDIAVDPRWEKFRAIAMPYGLRSCWSSPIRGQKGTTGTFAVYHDRAHQPSPREQVLVERFTHLASVAIDYASLFGALAESEERFRHAFGTARPAWPSPTSRGALSRLRSDGRVQRVAIAASLVRGAGGLPVHLSLNLQDITQQHAAERERRARREAEVARAVAEAASQAKSGFLTSLSHELRTPLQAVAGFAELLGTLDLPAPRREAALQHIQGATAHITSLVDDVLDIATIEAGALPLHLTGVDLADVIPAVLDLLSPLAAERGIILRQKPATGIVRADERRLRQVLINLITNAIRYNVPGGQVEVGTEDDTHAVTISVRDTGAGIPGHLLDRLFVPFDRLGAENGPEQGAGLGLPLALGLVEAGCWPAPPVVGDPDGPVGLQPQPGKVPADPGDEFRRANDLAQLRPLPTTHVPNASLFIEPLMAYREAMAETHRLADAGFHAGELSVQHRAGVAAEAARLARMLEPVELDGGIARFLAARTFAALTGRDRAGRLWVTPLTGPPGFLSVTSLTTLEVSTALPVGDPLHALPAGQQVGLVVVEFAARRRVRVNGTLSQAGPERLVIKVEQAYGNCPQYIQQRVLAPANPGPAGAGEVRHDSVLSAEDIELIRGADTFFLGTTHPERGSDASHRGGPPGFVRVDRGQLWWPDYPGNNLFNSFGNLAVDPDAALLFLDFSTGRTLQLSGTAAIEWGEPGRPGDDGHTGRRARFTPQRLAAGHLLAARQTAHNPYPRNPGLTSWLPL